MVQRLQLWVQLLCICILSSLTSVSSAAISADKAALLAFKALVSSDQGILSSWNSTSDPCSDAWLGVSCICTNLKPPISAAECVTAQQASAEDSVIALDFGAESIAAGLRMTGLVAPELGSLTQLQNLRLDGHSLQVQLLAFITFHLSVTQHHAHQTLLQALLPAACNPYAHFIH